MHDEHHRDARKLVRVRRVLVAPKVHQDLFVDDGELVRVRNVRRVVVHGQAPVGPQPSPDVSNWSGAVTVTGVQSPPSPYV